LLLNVTNELVDLEGYRKNRMGNDHGALFQECDLKHISPDEYSEEDYTPEDIARLREGELGFTRKLECYLDLEYKTTRPAEVIWTNFKRELGV
jgi:hypothetical protein